MDTLKNQNTLYQLPSFYKPKTGKHQHRIFVFLNTTDEAIEAVGKEAARCDDLELLKLWFEMGISEADVQRYLEMLKSAFPAEREIEIEYKKDIPAQLIQMWYLHTQAEIVKRRALLN